MRRLLPPHSTCGKRLSVQNQAMRKHFFHPAAWLLSVGVHLAVAGMLGPGPGQALMAAGLERPRTMAVHLVPPDSTKAPEADSSAEEGPSNGVADTAASNAENFSETVAGNTEPLAKSPLQSALPLDDDNSDALPALPLPEARYFLVGELTEKPFVVQDISPDMVIVLPDMFLPPAIVQLLISERGEVDKVVMEDDELPEEAQRFVMEAFSKVKFRPGRVGELPVKSRLSIEVTFENAARSLTPVSVSIVH